MYNSNMAVMWVCQISVFLALTSLIAGSLAEEGSSLFISHVPNYMHFRQDAGRVATSEISSIISSSFGHSLNKDLKWTGLEQGSLFHRPKANVLVSLEGVKDLNLKHVAKYPVDDDEVTVDTPAVANHLADRPQGEKSIVVDFSESNVYDVRSQYPKYLSSLPATLTEVREHLVGDRSAFTGLNVGTLNMTHNADAAFLGELQVIHEVIDALKSHSSVVKDNHPDLFHFHVNGMHKLVEVHGAQSTPVLDAQNLLSVFINTVVDDFKTLYNGHVMIEVLVLPQVDSRAHVRAARSLMQAATPEKEVSITQLFNIESAYTDDFAAIFNIILWLMVFMILIVVGVSYSMWTMDPGRDSIIYRMTSQRIKKD